jgi:hypothetical protein
MKLNTGLLLDNPEALSTLPDFELFFGNEKATTDWRSEMPQFRNQGSSFWCTAYAMTSIGSAFNKVEERKEILFSPFELFYRSGGSQYGNTLIAAANAAKNGFCLESNKPTPRVTAWGARVNEMYRELAPVSIELIDRRFALKSASFVTPDKGSLRKALAWSPVMLAIGIGRGYWDAVAPRQSSYSAYHAVVLVDILDTGEYVIFDSLAGKAEFDGFHVLASDYEILYALSFVDLPNDWETLQQEKKEEPFAFALKHYGLTRSLYRERMAAEDFRNTLKSHPTLQAHAAKLWTVLVNALAYGGYSKTDLLNHLTNLRRKGLPIFDLNTMR